MRYKEQREASLPEPQEFRDDSTRTASRGKAGGQEGDSKGTAK
jgi:hypothetical protein